MQRIPHTTIEGGDIIKADWPEMDRVSCRKACEREARCIAYTHDLWSGKCFLKDRIPLLRIEPKYESAIAEGYSAAARSQKPIEIIQRKNKSFAAGVTNTAAKAKDFRECAATCLESEKCWYIQFSHGNAPTCKLYSEAPEYEDALNTDVGVKWQEYE